MFFIIKYCRGGECTSKVPPKPIQVTPGGWGPWKEGVCSSNCIEKSVGFLSRQRFCNNPTPVNTDKGCEGDSYETVLCNDNNVSLLILRKILPKLLHFLIIHLLITL